MTDINVHIAGAGHTMNPSNHGFVIYAEWHCRGDSGEPVTITQLLEYTDTLAFADDLKARWTDALN